MVLKSLLRVLAPGTFGHPAQQSLLRVLAPALALLSAAAHSSSLPVRDQNPLLAGFNLPSALPADLSEPDRWTLDATVAWGSSAIVQTSARETLIVDAETRELRLALQRTFADGYALRIELPYRHTSAGSLDSFIDGWHRAFGLPEGARPSLPRDALQIAYRRDGETLLESRSPQSGVGDISVQVGRQLSAVPVAAWLGVKLPSGDAVELTGSGSVDVSAALASNYEFGERWAIFGQAASTWLGDGDRLANQQNEWAWSGTAGISARAFDNLTVIVQLDAHTAIYDADELEFLGDTAQLTLAATYRIGSTWELSFAVTEDIAVESAPDVVFLFGLKWRSGLGAGSSGHSSGSTRAHHSYPHPTLESPHPHR